MTWTRFMDMHSGGSAKTPYKYILIEAKKDLAIEIFTKRFGRDPNYITCDCCGEDFSIWSYFDQYLDNPQMLSGGSTLVIKTQETPTMIAGKFDLEYDLKENNSTAPAPAKKHLILDPDWNN